MNPDKDLNNYISVSLIKEKILANINFFLLVCFLILVCILNFIRFSYWYGTDAMYHAFLIKGIVTFNTLPVNQYFGAVGLHSFGAVIHFFSGVDIIHIPRYFLFYTIFVSALILYNLLMRIFRNKNLAFFGIFVLEFSTIGFINMMYQFWPTGIAVIQCLFIFFLLYCRLQKLIKLEKPDRKDLCSNLMFSYLLIIFTFISSLLTHSLITMILILSFFITFFLYFFKDVRRGIDFLILCGLMGIFYFFYSINLVSGHFYLINISNYPLHFIIIIVIGFFIILWRLKSSIHFTPGRFSMVIFGKKSKYYQIIENKYMLPMMSGIIIIILITFIIVNNIILDVNSSKYLLGLEVLLLALFGFWGLLIFQKKPRGKIFFLWFLSLCFLLAAAIFNDIFMTEQKWGGRISLLFATLLVIGFISYNYKVIKLGSIRTRKTKIIILSFIILSFFAHFYDELADIDGIEYNLKKREVYSIQWISNYNSEEAIVALEFGMEYVFMYYDYPFNEQEEEFSGWKIHYFVSNDFDFFNPENHFDDNDNNFLKYIKDYFDMEIYIFLDDNYLLMRGYEVYGRLTKEEMEKYYNMDYINRIFSVKSEFGVEVPCYWVI